MHTFTLASALFAAVSALQITSPAQVQNLPVQYNNGSITVTWTTVSTDPSSFNVALSANGGQSSTQVAQNVPASAGSLDVSLVGVAPGRNYQINFVAVPTPQNSGILAQSGQFEIRQGTGNTAASSTAAATTGAATTRAPTTSTGPRTTLAATTSGVVVGPNGSVITNGTTSRPTAVPSGSGATQMTVGIAGLFAVALALLA
jgi:fibronectin type 3 domain-containing protein